MKIKKFPKPFCEINYAYISFRFEAKMQETKQSVKRDKTKVEVLVRTESAIAFIKKRI